ncbi:MAG: CBS domain-containing protein [Nitrospirota bacterium]|nr:MAG: CBS domain-containing protein [Nitrospirota bacterium]
MKVKDLLKEKGTDIIKVEAASKAITAVNKMIDRNIGALLVESDGNLVGLVTERDIMKHIAQDGRPLEEVDTSVLMVDKDQLVVCEPKDDVEYAMTVMIKKRVRHIPVIEDKQLIGILSIRDVVRAHVKNLKAELHYLKDYMVDSYPV